MKKRALALLLCGVMAAGLMAGCGDKKDDDKKNPEPTKAADNDDKDDDAQATPDISEPVTLKVMFHGSTVTDDKAVLEEVNKYLGEKLNVTLEPIWGTWGDFDDRSVMSINGNDDIDIYFTCSWSADEYNAFAKKGAWVRLDDPENNLIEKYASELWSVLPEALTGGAVTNGANGLGVYAVPGYKDIATQNTWDVNVTKLKEMGYTIDDLKGKSFYEFGDICKAAKEKYGDSFYPLLVEGAVLERMVTNSVIITGDNGSTNMLSYYIDPTDITKAAGTGKIVNKFATDEYRKFVEKVNEYYKAGYIDPAMAIADQANDVRTSKQATGDYLIGTQSYSYGWDATAAAARGIEVAFLPCTEPYVDTTSAQGAMMAISSVSKNPDRAMMFLNLLNTDAKLMTMLNFGLEGTHYTVNADGEVEFNQDARASYSPWTNGMGNVTLLPPQKGQGADFQDQFKAFYAAAKEIPINGYSFDPTSLETEIAGLASICQEYVLALDTGAADTAKLDEFLKKLEDNGIQKVVDEANAQLDKFMAE